MLFFEKKKTVIEKVTSWFSSKKYKLEKAVWWVRHRTIDRYNVIKLSSLQPGYYDIDTRILHANFELLKQFVENEEPFDRIDWDHNAELQHVASEIKDLYNWWVNVFPKREELDPLTNVKCPKQKSTPASFDANGKILTWTFEQDGTPEEIEAWNKACKESNLFDEKCEKEEEDNLIRLIKIRKYLWT